MKNMATFTQCNWCKLQRDAPHTDPLCSECREMLEELEKNIDRAITGLSNEYKRLTGDDVEEVLAKEQVEAQHAPWPPRLWHWLTGPWRRSDGCD